MNVQRFTGRTSREAMQKMRAALGDDAVVLSTKPCAEGIEMLAMAPHALAQVEEHAASRFPAAFATTQQPSAEAPAQGAASRPAAGRTPLSGALRQAAAALAARAQPTPAASTSRAEVQRDVTQLSMSTLSFQDYVRERMLKKRDVALRGEASDAPRAEPSLGPTRASAPSRDAGASRFGELAAARYDDAPPSRFGREPGAASRHAAQASRYADDTLGEPLPAQRPAPQRAQPAAPRVQPASQRIAPPMLREEVAALADPLPPHRAEPAAAAHRETPREAQADAQMLSELRSMKGLIEERFGALAFMEKLQRQPAQARLTQKLLEAGFSPILIRKLVVGLTPEIVDETGWAASILERNLQTGERELAVEDQGGVFALVGATGVGKTTSTAKLAAAFATRHGASNLGLITLDAYRVGAHEQLRAYGRILGVPVHTAHDRTTLEDLLDLLSGKKMVLIDTAGLAQRDARTKELLDMLGHRSISRLLVVSAAAQGETIDDVLTAYRADTCKGIVLSKLDEAVKLAPALDAVIRHRQKIVAIANGQRVPEDWHRLSGQALVHRALRATASPAYHFDASEMNLVFAAPQMAARRITPSTLPAGGAANAARV